MKEPPKRNAAFAGRRLANTAYNEESPRDRRESNGVVAEQELLRDDVHLVPANCDGMPVDKTGVSL